MTVADSVTLDPEVGEWLQLMEQLAADIRDGKVRLAKHGTSIEAEIAELPPDGDGWVNQAYTGYRRLELRYLDFETQQRWFAKVKELQTP